MLNHFSNEIKGVFNLYFLQMGSHILENNPRIVHFRKGGLT